MFDEEKFNQAVQKGVMDAIVPVLSEISKAKDLPDFLTVSEAMAYTKIKTTKTWEKKVKEFNIKTHFLKLKNNLKTYKKEDIIEFYISEGKFF